MGNSIHSSINWFRNSRWDWERDRRTHNLLNYYQSLSKDLTDSLEEIANSLITIQNQLDSLVAVVLQNRRGLDLLTEKKEGYAYFWTSLVAQTVKRLSTM